MFSTAKMDAPLMQEPEFYDPDNLLKDDKHLHSIASSADAQPQPRAWIRDEYIANFGVQVIQLC